MGTFSAVISSFPNSTHSPETGDKLSEDSVWHPCGGLIKQPGSMHSVIQLEGDADRHEGNRHLPERLGVFWFIKLEKRNCALPPSGKPSPQSAYVNVRYPPAKSSVAVTVPDTLESRKWLN